MTQDFLIEKDYFDTTIKKYIGHSGDVIIPDNITCIGNSAFLRCDTLTEITIPKNVKSIQWHAFEDCINLKKVIFSGGIAKAGGESFGGSGVEEFLINDSERFYTDNGIVFDKTQKAIALYPCGKTGSSYIIPSEIERVGAHAFSGSSYLSLRIVYLPKTVKAIYETSFINLYVAYYNKSFGDKLKKAIPVFLGGGIDEIPVKKKQDAVKGWLYARKNGIHEIDTWEETYIEYIRRNEKTYIKQALKDHYLLQTLVETKALSLKSAQELSNAINAKREPELTALLMEYINTCEQQKPIKKAKATGERRIQNGDKTQKTQEEIKNKNGIAGLAFVATGEMKRFGFTYENGEKDWSDLKEYIEKRGGFLRSSVSSKTDYLIFNGSGHTAKLKKALQIGTPIITEEEFMKMAEQSELIKETDDFKISKGKILTKYNGKDRVVTIPEGVLKIGSDAFAETEIEEVFIPETVIEIKNSAFYGCKNLKQVHFSEGLEVIGDGVFLGCDLENLILPRSVKTIKYLGCGVQKKVRIYDSVEKTDGAGLGWSLFSKDIDIELIFESDDAIYQKQLVTRIGIDYLAYAFLHGRLTANDEVIERVKKRVAVRENRYIITEEAIQLNDVAIFEHLMNLGIKMSKKEIDKYIETASANNRLEIVAWLLDYKNKQLKG